VGAKSIFSPKSIFIASFNVFLKNLVRKQVFVAGSYSVYYKFKTKKKGRKKKFFGSQSTI
jgi:hypothetical protein